MREIENALLANHKRLYHLGMEAVAKSTLSEAMNRRNPEIFKALFEEILDRVMVVAPKHKFKLPPPTLGLTEIWCCSIHRMLMAKYKRFHSSVVCSTATAGSVKQRNFRTIPFTARQVAKISRKATPVPILAKLGTKSRFWALSAISKCQFDTWGMELPNLLILDCFSNLA